MTPGTHLDTREIQLVLQDMIQAHERWLVIISDHRAALSQSDTRSSELCTAAQQEIMAQIAGLESKRQDLLQIAALDRAHLGSEPLTITELAEQVDEPSRANLLQSGERLLSLIETTRREQETLALAACTLAAHMEGLVRQVASKLQSAATYSPAGTSSPPISAGLDIVQ